MKTCKKCENYRHLGEYSNPRISSEYLDCSMPICIDQYNACGFDCQYCFSFFQRAFNQACRDDYLNKNVKVADIRHLKDIFLGNVKNDKDKAIYNHFIKKRRPIQWGGLSDPFCPFERKYGAGYDLMKLLADMKYPISFSTKGDLCIEPKYMDLWKKSPKTFHFKISIITLDEKKAKKVEKGCPSPERRLEVMEKLNEIGCPVTLRLRPFTLGLSEDTYEELIREASKRGAVSLSTEFFCLDTRGDKSLRERYEIMSEVCGFDIYDFYRENSLQSGYLRLNPEIKKPYFLRMREICREEGMQFHVSDNDFKELGDSGSCCGLPKDNSHFQNYPKCQWTNIITKARKNPDKELHFSDFLKTGELDWEEEIYYGDPFNVSGAENYRRVREMSILDYRRDIWNKPKSGKSPFKYFNGKLEPVRVDKNGDVVYKYKKEGYEDEN